MDDIIDDITDGSLTIPLQSKVRMWTSRTPALPRGVKGFEISLESKQVNMGYTSNEQIRNN